MAAKDSLPTISRRVHSSGSARAEPRGNGVWIRLTAFLSTRAPRTRIVYSGVLKEFCEFLGAQVATDGGASALIAATDLEALAYRHYLEQKPGQRPRTDSIESGQSVRPSKSRAVETSRRKMNDTRRDGYQSTLTNSTIAKKLSALRRMYRALIAAGVGVTKNPFDSDSCPTPPKHAGQKRPTEMIEFELVQEIIAVVDDGSAKGLRDRAMLALLFGCGLRRGELVKLRIREIKRSQSGTPYLELRATKAQRDARQAVPEWAAAIVNKLIEQRRNEKATGDDFLFVGYRGRAGKVPSREPISESGLYHLFKNACKRVGAGAHLSPHSARATAITKLLTDGFSHREVQEFSRHASVAMVENYDKRRLSIDENPGKKLKF